MQILFKRKLQRFQVKCCFKVKLTGADVEAGPDLVSLEIAFDAGLELVPLLGSGFVFFSADDFVVATEELIAPRNRRIGVLEGGKLSSSELMSSRPSVAEAEILEPPAVNLVVGDGVDGALPSTDSPKRESLSIRTVIRARLAGKRNTYGP